MSDASGEPRALSVRFGRRRIDFALRYAARRTLAIDVNPDQSVVVTAPAGSPDESVLRVVSKRAAWIVDQQRFFAAFLPALPPRRYVSGESHRYLGRQYRLRVARAEADVQVMRDMYRPMATIRTGPSYTMTDGRGWMAMVGLSLPIWRGKLRAGVAEAQAMHAMSEADLRAMTRVFEGEAATASHQVQAWRDRRDLQGGAGQHQSHAGGGAGRQARR